jgi:uroporphyrinogen decarboxylase
MPQSPREIVQRTLTFDYPERIPRFVWKIPWSEKRFPDILAQLDLKYPDDILRVPSVYRPSPRIKGNPYDAGSYVDEWGSEYMNLQEGVIGEVTKPAIPDINDLSTFKPPYEMIPEPGSREADIVNRFCACSGRFVLPTRGLCLWERLQFLRGTVNALIDTATPDGPVKGLLKKIHDFYIKELEFWVSTDVDGIYFVDDWGSQTNLLISPSIWRELFKPLYKEFCDLAHSHGKFVFMHSDGCILSIYEDIIEIGVDAINSQLFTMDMEEVARIAKGRITFWGEIDQQNILASTDEQVVRDAVRKVAKHFYDPRGGIIIEFVMGAGFHGPNALVVMDEWEKVQAEMRADKH